MSFILTHHCFFLHPTPFIYYGWLCNLIPFFFGIHEGLKPFNTLF
jgi:hypothetical protein